MRLAETLSDRLALGVLLLFAIVAALTFRDYGLGWDDYTHSEYGDLLLRLYGTGFSDRSAFGFVNLYMYGGGFDMAAALAAKILPFTLFETRRLAGAVVGLIGYALTWRCARRLGGPEVGLFSLLLFVLMPHYYGHVFMNAKDIPFAVAVTAFLYAALRALEEFPKPSSVTVILFGLGLGLAFGTRILAVVEVACFGLAAIFVATITMRRPVAPALRDFGLFVLSLTPALLIAYLIMGLLWPWSITQPLNPLRAIEYFSHFFEKPWRELYEGALVPVPAMPPSYIPQLFALKMPLATLVVALTGIAISAWRVLDASQPARRRATYLLILLAALFPVAVAMVTRPALYNGIRHFLFITPPLAILAGVAANALWTFSRTQGRKATAAFACLFGIGLLFPIADMVRLHPYEYTAFNGIVGGVAGANENYMLDYWGLSFKEVSAQLREELDKRGEKAPPGKPWVVGVCGPQRHAQVALGRDFRTIGNPVGADFIMALGAFYCRKLDLPVLAEVEREGVIYARVYDARGHNVTTFNTIPPP